MNLEEKKAELLKEIPSDYRPLHHLTFMMGLSLIMVLSLSFLLQFNYYLLLIPAFFISFLLVEWLIHKYLLHQNNLPSLYKFHQGHHLLFQDNDMKVKTWNDLYWVLIPIHVYNALFFGLLILTVCIAFFNMQLAIIFIFSAYLFHIFYECTHLLWHLSGFNRFSRFHHIHHKFSNMLKFNMNVTVPLIDLLARTLKTNKE
jgi:hypothetical protein